MQLITHMLKDIEDRMANVEAVRDFLDVGVPLLAKGRMHFYRRPSPQRPVIIIADRSGTQLMEMTQGARAYDLRARVSLRFERDLDTDKTDADGVLEFAELLEQAIDGALEALRAAPNMAVHALAATSDLLANSADERSSEGIYLTREFTMSLTWIPIAEEGG